MALPFWCSLSLMTLPSEAPAPPPRKKRTFPYRWNYWQGELVEGSVTIILALLRWQQTPLPTGLDITTCCQLPTANSLSCSNSSLLPSHVDNYPWSMINSTPLRKTAKLLDGAQVPNRFGVTILCKGSLVPVLPLEKLYETYLVQICLPIASHTGFLTCRTFASCTLSVAY